MTGLTAAFATRLTKELGSPFPVALVTGSCEGGRASLLLKIRELVGPTRCQYVNVERVASTPERFLRALVEESSFRGGPHTEPRNVTGPREAFDASLAFLTSACTDAGEPATFLLDEALDVRTFENFPGLRTVMQDLVTALRGSPNRFVLATRFTTRGARLVAESQGSLALRPMPTVTPDEVRDALGHAQPTTGFEGSADDLARTVHALADGRPCYVQALLDAMRGAGGDADPVGALASLLGEGRTLATHCRFSYEFRLHRARGYGALKGILAILAEDEPLTLTAVSRRLERTPGSTKDYLGWLEDVDLVVVERRRYRFADPLLRLWVRLQTRSVPASDDAVAREVQRYALVRLAAEPRGDTAAGGVVATAVSDPRSPAAARARSSGIVEFD